MSETFTLTLRDENRETWDRAVQHRFVRELCDGTVPDPVMAGYLVQDHRFLDAFLVLLGSAISSADTFAARIRLSQFVGDVAGDENTYFLRSFEALGAPEEARDAVPDTDATRGFTDLFREAAATGSYAAVLGVLAVVEGLYLDWAQRAPSERPESFVHAGWIELHDNPAFRDLVAFLEGELDRVGPQDAEVARAFFARAVALELAFFDAAYAHPFEGAAA